VKNKIVMTGRISGYEAILEGIIAAKPNQKIINSTIAFFIMAKVVREYLKGKAESLQEALEEGVEETVQFTLRATRKRIHKETAKALRKAMKKMTDSGLDLDAALLSLAAESSK
jgi:hypothetical protein